MLELLGSNLTEEVKVESSFGAQCSWIFRKPSKKRLTVFMVLYRLNSKMQSISDLAQPLMISFSLGLTPAVCSNSSLFYSLRLVSLLGAIVINASKNTSVRGNAWVHVHLINMKLSMMMELRGVDIAHLNMVMW